MSNKTRAVILAGGEGSRLGTLTAKRTKPAVPFAGKYRIIDFTLSNCVNSGLFDIMILAQYRPHSLIDHIGAGGPWDLNRDFTGGVRIYTPYKARGASDWYLGTADAVQQNFRFIKNSNPDQVIILSGDHIYEMNYDAMLSFHHAHSADLTMATIRVSKEEAKRFGVVDVDENNRVTSFVEKPEQPPSDLANMGVYIFDQKILDKALLEDHNNKSSSHDFGKDILPRLITSGARIIAYPFDGYWVDVGTVDSYWLAHMDLLGEEPIDLNNRSWIIHTRTEERPPVRIQKGAIIENSMITDGCDIASGARIVNSVLSPGVRVESGAFINHSVILTDAEIESNAKVEYTIIDKRVRVGENSHVGSHEATATQPKITMVGKNSHISPELEVISGAVIATDVIPSDYPSNVIRSEDYIQTKRLPYEV